MAVSPAWAGPPLLGSPQADSHLLAVLGSTETVRARRVCSEVRPSRSSSLSSADAFLIWSYPGTTALCYQGQESDPAFRGAVDQPYVFILRPSVSSPSPLLQIQLISVFLLLIRRTPLDPAAEFSRIRQSLALLESHIYQQPVPRQPANAFPAEHLRRNSIPSLPPLYESHVSSRASPDPEGSLNDKDRNEDVDMTSTPGMLGQQASGGLYAGPTSAASHLITVSPIAFMSSYVISLTS